MPSLAPRAGLGSPGPALGDLAAEHMFHTFARVVSGPGVEIDADMIRMVTGEPHPFGNFVCFGPNASEAQVVGAVPPLLDCGAPAAVLFAGPAHPAALERVRSLGFADAGGMPVMGVDIARLAQTTLPAGCRFERVEGAGVRDAWGEVFARGYELPPAVGAAFAGGLCDDQAGGDEVRYFWILQDGVPVATSLVALGQGVAGVYGVATVPQARGRGLGAHATAEALRQAQRLGYGVGVLQSSEMGHPVYRRLGFMDLSTVPLLVRMPG